MDSTQRPANLDPKELVKVFVEQSSGLSLKEGTNGELSIFQQVDGKSIRILLNNIEEVLSRQDSEGHHFIQVNFFDGKKIIITEKLVGFKPIETTGLDVRKLPKVVTTPDLVSVIEAIEESLSSQNSRAEEIDVLKRVFDSVLQGAEAVGFELTNERSWLNFITTSRNKPAI